MIFFFAFFAPLRLYGEGGEIGGIYEIHKKRVEHKTKKKTTFYRVAVRRLV